MAFSTEIGFLKGLWLRLEDLFKFVWHKTKAGWKWYKRTYKEARWYKRAGMLAVTFVVLFFVYLGMVDVNFLWLFGKSPGINRLPVTYDEIPPMLVKALVSTEDERFYKHFGIDFQGVFAAVKDMVVHGDARGASTITQQLVKNMFKTRTEYSTGLLGYIPGVRMLIMKTKEWITAVKIEMFYSKEEILTMYFNTVDFGSNSFGIKTACRTYFNTTPDKLTYEQAATLVGLLKATSTWRAPTLRAARELATPRPRSSWQCTEKMAFSAPSVLRMT